MTFQLQGCGAKVVEGRLSELLAEWDIAPVQLQRIDEGGGSCWIINENFVIRLSLCGSSDQIAKEAKLRSILAAALGNLIPTSISTGDVELGGKDAPFTIDTRLHGQSLEHVEHTSQTKDDLVELLRVLGRKSMIDAVQPLVPILTPGNLGKLHFEAVRAQRRMLERNESLPANCSDDVNLNDCHSLVCKAASTIEEEYLQEMDQDSVLLHGDLKGEHILIGPDGSVNAVLDWSDSCIGPPSVDIEGLVISVGAGAAVEIGLRAGHKKTTCTEGLFMARCNTLIRLDDILYGEDTESPMPLLRNQLSRAFASGKSQ